MTVQMSGPLPRQLVVAALSQPSHSHRRARRWMRRRGLRPVPMPATTRVEPTDEALSISTDADFVQCHHPGCCALRALDSDPECAVCGRR